MEEGFNNEIAKNTMYVIYIRDGKVVGTAELDEGQHACSTAEIEKFGGLNKFKERYKELTGKDYEVDE